MRKCLRCDTEMQEGYALYDESFHGRVLLGKEKSFFQKSRASCAVLCARNVAIRSCM